MCVCVYLFYLQCALDVGFGLEMSSDAVALHRLMKLLAKIILDKRHSFIAADLCEAAWSDIQTIKRHTCVLQRPHMSATGARWPCVTGRPTWHDML